MNTISKNKLYEKKIDLQLLKDTCSTVESVHKHTIISYLKNSKRASSCTTERVYDYFEDHFVEIPIVAYHDDKYYWDDRDIYYFEKYNMKLNDDFINHVLEQEDKPNDKV